VESRLRGEAARSKLEVLERLQACEQSSWKEPPAVDVFPREEAPPAAASLCGSAEEGGAAHRIATRAHRKARKAGPMWTVRFEELFDRAGMSLRDPLNLIYLQEHAQPHSEAYHQAIFDRLQATLEGCGDRETCGEVLRMALRRLRAELCTPDTELSSLVTW